MTTGISAPQSKQFFFHHYHPCDLPASGPNDVPGTVSIEIPFKDWQSVEASAGAALANVEGPVSAASYRVKVVDAVARWEPTTDTTYLDINFMWNAGGAGVTWIRGILFMGVAQGRR